MTLDDADLLFELDQDSEVMRFINKGKKTTLQEVHEVFIPRLKAYRNEVKGWGIWQVTLKDSGRYIGWVLVRPMAFFSENPELENLELGWRFKRDIWGKGYATEAACALKEALINKGGIKKLSAIAVEANKASTNVMLKLGMRYLKTELHKDPLGDAEVVFYEMTLV